MVLLYSFNVAIKIERIDCEFAGGLQDQYSASFGGFNFIEFKDFNIMHRFDIPEYVLNELEQSIILYYTGKSRKSSEIIKTQKEQSESHDSKYFKLMDEIKESTYTIKGLLINNDIESLGKEIKKTWMIKKRISNEVTNKYIEDTISRIEGQCSGIYGYKVTGAGGGGCGG